MGSIYHRHRGGNHPHIHREHDGTAMARHDHVGVHQHDHRGDRRAAYHAYDVRGNRPAMVQADPVELGHWHFDSPFEHLASIPLCDRSQESAATALAFSNHDFCCLPLAARPPPALV